MPNRARQSDDGSLLGNEAPPPSVETRRSHAAPKRETRWREHTTKAEELVNLLASHRGERHVIVLQSFPDPDAISSALAHQAISSQFEITCDIVYGGAVSHHENIALIELLGIALTRLGPTDKLTGYDGSVFVDTQGSTTGLTKRLTEAQIPPLVVVDHHEPQGLLQAAFTDIRTDSGATATIYTQYLEAVLPLDRSAPEHTRLATALMHGIRSETEGLIRAREEDLRAAAYLADLVDHRALEAILSMQRSRNAMDAIMAALRSRTVRDNYSIAGIGYVRFEDRDAIPQAADFLLTEENVHTTIVFGLVTKPDETEVIIGSLRTKKPTFNPDTFIKDALGGGEPGRFFGGGRRQAGGFEIPVGFLAGHHDEVFMQRKWSLFSEQVSRKLWTKLGVLLELRPSVGEEDEEHGD